MAQAAMNITTDGNTTKDELAVSYGNLIDAIQKNSVSEQIKNKNYSGDPTTGSVKVDRFNNAQSNDYGTARAAGKGSGLTNSGKVTINIDQDKEIVEEIENKDAKMFGIPNLIARRGSNHANRVIAELDNAFFKAAEAEATAVTDITDTDIAEVAEGMIQKVETVENDFVDGVPRDMIVLVMTPKAYGKLRNHIDKVSVPTVDSGTEIVNLFHGVRVFSNVRQKSDIIAMTDQSVAQPATFNEYEEDHVPLSNAVAVELFYSYGTKAVCPDLLFKLAALPVAPEANGASAAKAASK